MNSPSEFEWTKPVKSSQVLAKLCRNPALSMQHSTFCPSDCSSLSLERAHHHLTYVFILILNGGWLDNWNSYLVHIVSDRCFYPFFSRGCPRGCKHALCGDLQTNETEMFVQINCMSYLKIVGERMIAIFKMGIDTYYVLPVDESPFSKKWCFEIFQSWFNLCIIERV